MSRRAAPKLVSEETSRSAAAVSVVRHIPRSIWTLGCVSLLMDVSSEMIHGLLPVFLTAVLGAGALAVGVIEGAAEATALVVKVFSGVLSDYWGTRKPLAVLGYGLGAMSKPLFAIAPSAGFVLAARLIAYFHRRCRIQRSCARRGTRLQRGGTAK